MTTYWMQDYQTEGGRRLEIVVHPAEAERVSPVVEELALLILGPTFCRASVKSFRTEVPPSAPRGFDAGTPALHFTYTAET